MPALMRAVAFSAIALFATAAIAADDHFVTLVFKDGHRQTFTQNELSRIDLKAPSVVVFKDGRQQKIATADIARIEFEPAEAPVAGRAHYIGKWEVGDGNGHNFFITLDEDGSARKSIGAAHGTWTVVDGEARVTWDDGWHDAIRKVGTKHEKFAYAPEKSFDDSPSNVTSARNTQPKPI